MKKILNISVSDYANFGHDNAEALRSVGCDVTDIAISPHIFQYESCSKVIPLRLLNEYLNKSDIIQCFHSPNGLADFLRKTGKPVIVYHTGTGYRQQPSPVHKAFDGWVHKHVCALPELYEAFKKRSNEPVVYMVGGVKVPGNVSFATNTPAIIGHYPSNPEVKGTNSIKVVFEELKKEGLPLSFNIDIERVPYNEQLKRIESCDIYVEMMASHQGKEQYGSFGITALEAASRGKIVITNCTHLEPYKEHYVDFPFIIANDPSSLELALVELSEMTPEEITELKKSYHALFTSMHSMEATGEYLINNVLKGLL